MLDEMEEVDEVHCTSNSVSIEIIPESDFDILFLMVFIVKPRSETKGGGGNRIILISKPD